MSEHLNERIGELLRQDAPPAHDPAFRISVLERRERKRFLRHSVMLCALAVALAAIAFTGIAIGGDAAINGVALAIAIALVAAYRLYAPAVTNVLQRFGL